MKKENAQVSSKIYLKEFFTYAVKYKFYIFAVCIFSVLESIVSVLNPKLTGMIIDSISSTNIDLDYTLRLILWLFLFYSAFTLFSCLNSYFVSAVSINVTYDLRKRISKKIDKITIEYLQKNGRGDILSRIINDVDALSNSLAGSINQIISEAITSIGIVAMMFYISVEMSICAFAMLPVIGIIVLIILKKSQKYFVEYQTTLGEINSYVEQSLSGYEVIKTFEAESKFSANFSQINNSIYNSSWKSQFLSSLVAPAIEFISKINYVISCVIGGYFVVMRGFSLGDISAFIAYSGKFIQPLLGFAQLSGIVQQAFVVAHRIFEFLNAPEEEVVSKSLGNSCGLIPVDKIEFKNVTFQYPDGDLAINDFSFAIKAGQTIAVVGQTGAGKSTLINLLMRFYNINSGEILLNGKNIRDFSLQEYRKLFGVVTQDSWLYTASIAENIRYGRLNATDEDIKKAANFVGAAHFIETLENGYRTVVSENTSNVSHGQRQLICIARMVLCGAPILVMDEATSSVDVFTELQIQNALKKTTKNKTSIIIAHRLSTIINADVIIVMDKGKLVELGTHSSLIAKKGVYYDMYQSSFMDLTV